MASRRATRARGRIWAGWLAILLGTGVLAGGFVALRNAQVSAGQRLKDTEERLADLESEIELYEARLAGATSRPELSAKLQERKPELRRLGLGEAIRLERRAGVAPVESGED